MTVDALKTPLAEREVTITRVFRAPRALVFKAWTDPKHLAQWWGPHGFTNPVCEFDARVGGAIRIDMRSPDGIVFPTAGVVREIVPPERLVFTHGPVDAAGHHLIEGLTTLTLTEEERGITKLTMHTRAVALVEQAVPWLGGMDAGWTQSLERLTELVEKTSAL